MSRSLIAPAPPHRARSSERHHGVHSRRLQARVVPVLAFALSMLAGLPFAVAQAPSPSAPSDQDHNAHHPDDAAQAAPNANAGASAPSATERQTPTAPGAMPMMGGMGQGGMMGRSSMMDQGGSSGMGQMMGNMGQMMPMAGGMMAQGGGMGMPFEHVEGRLAFLKTELKITPTQEPQWNKFADAYRSVAKNVREQLPQMMRAGAQTPTASDRLDRYEQMLTMRLDAVRTMKAAFDPLYTSLSDEQKKTADQLIGSRMGLM